MFGAMVYHEPAFVGLDRRRAWTDLVVPPWHVLVLEKQRMFAPELHIGRMRNPDVIGAVEPVPMREGSIEANIVAVDLLREQNPVTIVRFRKVTT